MAKKDYYLIEKTISKLNKNGYTYFLDPATYKKVIAKINFHNYKTYYPYKECDKILLYQDNIPPISLLELISYDQLTHREIMGSIYNQGFDPSLFGDIIITNNHYYLIVISEIVELLKKDLLYIGNHHIKIIEANLALLSDYKRSYEELSITTSSLRIDNVISSIIGTSREAIKKYFSDELIVLNYEIINKPEYHLTEGDVFSIRRYGKYRFDSIIKITKKNHYLIKILKYIDK